MPGSHPGKAANDEITTIVHGTRSVITGTGQELNPNGYHVISRKEIKNGKRSGHQHLGTWGNKADAMKDAAKYKADGDDVMVMVPKGKK
jgi:hypothetical protein